MMGFLWGQHPTPLTLCFREVDGAGEKLVSLGHGKVVLATVRIDEHRIDCSRDFGKKGKAMGDEYTDKEKIISLDHIASLHSRLHCTWSLNTLKWSSTLGPGAGWPL